MELLSLHEDQFRIVMGQENLASDSAECHAMIRDNEELKGDYTPEETARRRDEAIRRALNTPPKPQSEIAGKSGRKRRVPAKSRLVKKQ